MNDDTIADLKQFIAATVTQQTSDLRSDINKLDAKLSTKLDDISKSVSDALDNSNDATQTQLDDHETRIVNLEQKAA